MARSKSVSKSRGYTRDQKTGLMRLKKKPGPKKVEKLSKSKCGKGKVYSLKTKRCHKRKSLSKKRIVSRSKKRRSLKRKSVSRCVFSSKTKRCHKRKSASKKRKSRSKKRIASKSKKKSVIGPRLCVGKSKVMCGADPRCNYTVRGCVARSGVNTGKLVYQGPIREFQESKPKLEPKPVSEPEPKSPSKINYFQNKKPTCKTIKGPDVCVGRNAKACGADPNCKLTLKGCMSRCGVLTGKKIYQGPIREF